MVVARLVKQSLAIPEVRTSNLVIGIIYIEHLFTVNCIQEKKIKKKGPGMAYFAIFVRWLKLGADVKNKFQRSVTMLC